MHYKIRKFFDGLFRVNGKRNHRYLKDFDIWEESVPNSFDLFDYGKFRKLGFSSDEVYSLDYTLTLTVYERLRHYISEADSIVNLEFSRFSVTVLLDKSDEYYKSLTYRDLFDGKDVYDKEVRTLTQRECINLIINYLEYYITEYERENRLYDEECDRLGLNTINEKLKSDDLKNTTLRCLIEETKSYEKRRKAFEILSIIIDTLWI